MAISEVGGVYRQESFVSSSTSTAFATGTGANRAAFALVGRLNTTPAPTGVSLSGGDVLSPLGAQFLSNGNYKFRWYALNNLVGTGSQTATATWDDNSGLGVFMVWIIQGDGSLTLGTPVTGAALSTSPSFGPTSALSDFVMAMILEFGGLTPTLSPTSPATLSSTFATPIAWAMRRTGTSGTTTIAGTFGAAADWAGAAIAITEAGGGGGPSITADPSNQTVTAPATATFSATYTGTIAGFQWQQSTDGGSTWGSVPDGTGASGGAGSGATLNYTTTATAVGTGNHRNGYRYRLQLNPSGTPINSASATLTVNAGPAVTVNPSNQSVTAPATATFSATYTGSISGYQWQRSTDSGATWGSVPDGTGGSGGAGSGATLSYITTATAVASGNHRNGYQYRLRLNPSGSPIDSTAATLSVSAAGTAPSINTQPSSQTVTAPATATFTGSASGSGSLSYQWQVSTDNGSTWNNVSGGSGATTPSYTTAATTTGDNGKRFRFIVTGDTNPPATSNGLATLTVNSGSGGVTFSGTVPSKTGTSGYAFSFGTPTLASYFTGAGTYGLLTGVLPPGMQLNAASGIIYGFPTEPGSYPVSVRKVATSGSPPTADSNVFTITITGTPTPRPEGPLPIPLAVTLTGELVFL